MQWQTREPQYAASRPGSVAILEAAQGWRRDAAVQRWLDGARAGGAETWRLECAQEVGGVWAGLGDLVESLIPRIRQSEPDLLAAYGYEISLVLPHHAGRLPVSRPLTETTAPGERTRNYPADRVDRSLHGLIDLLSEWHGQGGTQPWVIACDNYDRANELVQRFFQELIRRRGRRLGVRLLLCAGPGRGDAIAAEVPAGSAAGFLPEGMDAGAVVADRWEMERRAAALEAVVRSDPYGRYADLPRLIHYWQQSRVPERARRWQVAAINIFNHRGLYRVSLDYADEVEADLDRIRAEDSERYLSAVNGLYFCRVTLDQADRARPVIEDSLDHIDPSEQPHMLYLLAMLHARFLGQKDLETAERYLGRALELVAEVDLPDDDRHFMTVFLMNGLALIRVRQQRSEEAVALCQAGLRRLEDHLGSDVHRLHRSVLLYNIAQVYAQAGPYERALDYFGQTMEMDPNYSEYYNDRGSVYYKMGRFEEAEVDFRAAIGLSPPYPEVWINLGQCYRALDRLTEAVAAYSRALDLDPASALAWAGRADAHAGLGRGQEAVGDYDEALRRDPGQPLVWGGRAVVHYDQGHVRQAMADLDRAVELAPDMGELRQNRAVARLDLGLEADAAADLRRYLELCPDAGDRAEVAGQLQSLLMAAAS
jgi:tetratricopeptide (TPR) repeat protein